MVPLIVGPSGRPTVRLYLWGTLKSQNPSISTVIAQYQRHYNVINHIGEITSVEITSVKIISVEITSVEITSVEIISVEINSVEIISVEIISVEITRV